jgi:hypothetical protein
MRRLSLGPSVLFLSSTFFLRGQSALTQASCKRVISEWTLSVTTGDLHDAVYRCVALLAAEMHSGSAAMECKPGLCGASSCSMNDEHCLVASDLLTAIESAQPLFDIAKSCMYEEKHRVGEDPKMVFCRSVGALCACVCVSSLLLSLLASSVASLCGVCGCATLPDSFTRTRLTFRNTLAPWRRSSQSTC